MPNISRNDAIAAKFIELRAREEGALIAYLTGNDPNPEAFLANCIALVEGGADILEVGIPFSDPIADGPVIQASSMRALEKGATVSGILDNIRKLSSAIKIPIVALTYYNPIMAMGLERFFKRAAEVRLSGVVIPDLPVEETEELQIMATKHSVDNVLLAAPNTSNSRLRRILDCSQGFLYLVSLYGVTGPRDALSPQALETVTRVKKLANGRIPVSAGFGVSRPEHVSSLLSSGADGAIVGSALVRIVSEHLNEPADATNQLRTTVARLKQATRERH